MPSHLVRVKSHLFVRSRRRVARAVDGEYASRTRGRGIDLDDLRDYQPGDSVRDIDWKATARRGEPLVRRYQSPRQRSLVVIADTGTTMQAVTPARETKADLAVLASGILGYLAVRHGDQVGLVHGDAGGAHARRLRDGERPLDAMLSTVHDAITGTAAGPDVAGLVEHALPRLRRDTIAVVVTDDLDVDDRLATAVHRLARAHDTLWVTVADANPARLLEHGPVTGTSRRGRVPAHLARTRALADEHDAHAAVLRARVVDLLDEAHVSRCRIESDAHAVREVLTMLQRRPYAR